MKVPLFWRYSAGVDQPGPLQIVDAGNDLAGELPAALGPALQAGQRGDPSPCRARCHRCSMSAVTPKPAADLPGRNGVQLIKLHRGHPARGLVPGLPRQLQVSVEDGLAAFAVLSDGLRLAQGPGAGNGCKWKRVFDRHHWHHSHLPTSRINIDLLTLILSMMDRDYQPFGQHVSLESRSSARSATRPCPAPHPSTVTTTDSCTQTGLWC